jgi:hypothetical protein
MPLVFLRQWPKDKIPLRIPRHDMFIMTEVETHVIDAGFVRETVPRAHHVFAHEPWPGDSARVRAYYGPCVE